jgi:hypothetical protein
MARIRTVKPEFFSHEDLYDLESETGLPVRLAFVGLWTVCDRAGRFKWRPRSIKAQVMPYDDIDFSRVLDALATRGFVVRYASNGVDYAWIPGFNRHQVINNREAASVLPEPPEGPQNIGDSRVGHASVTREAREGHASCGEGKGMEGKGKEIYTESDKPTSGSVSVFVPEPKTPKAKAVTDLPPPDGVDSQHWSDWIIARRRKKSGPITKTVIEILQREAKLSGLSVGQAVAMCAGKGWINFDHSWVNGGKKIEQANQITPIPFGKRTDIA